MNKYDTMTEETKYSQLEDSLIRLKFNLSQMVWWRRLCKISTRELKVAMEEVHSSLSLMHAHLEFCKVTDQSRCIKLLRETEDVFFNAFKQYPSLNKWNYWIKSKWSL